MLLKTMLLLINIAVIGILACLIVKLYYRDEERENRVEAVDDFEHELKDETQVPRFENAAPVGAIASTRNRIKEGTSRASKMIIPGQKEDDEADEESLNKEIESLTITKAKPTKTAPDVEAPIPTTTPTTTETPKPTKTTPDFEAPKPTNTAPTTEAPKPTKVQTISSEPQSEDFIQAKEEPKVEREPVSINVKNIGEETDLEDAGSKTSLKTTATKPEAVAISDTEVPAVENTEEAQKEEKTVLQTSPNISAETEETASSLVEGLKNKEETVAIKETPSINEGTATEVQETPAVIEETPAIKMESPTIELEETPAVQVEKTPSLEVETPTVEIEERPTAEVQETPTIETKTNVEEIPDITTETAELASESEGTIVDSAEEKLAEIEQEMLEEKTTGIVSNISQEPIEKQHQTILDETRKITNETPSDTLDPFISEDIDQTLKDKFETEQATEELAKTTDPIESVKDTFQNIKSIIKGKEIEEEEEDIAPIGTNDVVLDEILNNNTEEFNGGIDYNDDIVSITPLHDPEEIEKYKETMEPEYDTIDIFNNIDGSTSEITPEEIAFFDNLEKGYTQNQAPKEEKIVSPSQKFHQKREKAGKPKTLRPPAGKDEAVITLQDQDYILKRGKSIIYTHQGEKYGSSIHSINGDNLNVTYRGKKIWIKTSDVTKVF